MSHSPEKNIYCVHEVNDLRMTSTEQMGSKDKFWVELDDADWLFKYPLRFDGERWSEMVAYEVGRMMELPIAEIELGVYEREDGAIKKGTLSKAVVDKEERGEELIHGNEAMAEMDLSGYLLDDEGSPGLDAVIDYLRRYDVVGPDGDGRGADYFVGYLVLDGLIGNVDRHHENWGVVANPSGPQRLARSFDHGACLGRELGGRKRHNYLSNKQVSVYVGRGRAKISPPNTVERVPPFELLESLDGLGLGQAKRHWIDCALAIDMASVDDLFARFPEAWIDADQWRFALAYMEQTRQYLEDLR